jgi:hypothetical protein
LAHQISGYGLIGANFWWWKTKFHKP